MRLSQPALDSSEVAAVTRVLQSEFLGMGKEVIEFEKSLSEFFANEVVCVNTGTSALQLALSASGIGLGDEVLVPSLTYVATYQAISALGAIPVSCDVQEDDLQIDVRDSQRRITKKTKAIVPVYFSGATNCADRVHEFSLANNLVNIPDAAHAFGSSHQGQRVGSGTGTNIFSLDGIKNITSGEGGIIVSSNPDVIKRASDARLLGVSGDSAKRASRERSWDFDVENQGWRFHMSDLFAAIGKVQLGKFESFAQSRKELFSHYLEMLAAEPRIELPGWDIAGGMVPHIFVIRIPRMTSREVLRESLASKGIPTGIHYKPNHLLSYYQNSQALPLLNTMRIYPEILTLPLHPRLTRQDQVEIVEKLRSSINDAFK